MSESARAAPREEIAAGIVCRSCAAAGLRLMIDLGMQPLANSYVPPERAADAEPFYPLTVYRCDRCYLAQIPQFVPATEIFSEYRYFSSYSTSWVDHARAYMDMVSARFALGAHSRIVEVASNDGYLLQFAVARGLPALGVEPAANVAQIARQRGVTTRVAFFGAQTARELADEGWGADLIVANNVLAHVPDINDFVAGFAILLKADGVASFEFPHFLNLLREIQFDTIYHEHFSYLCLISANKLFARHGLRVFDVEKLPTHGGSLRLFVARADSAHEETPAVARLLAEERSFGLNGDACYEQFAQGCRRVRNELLRFLIDCSEGGKTVCGYGAAAKGNTLLNFCGVRADLIRLVADRSPEKQGRLLPGTRIPVCTPGELADERPDYVLILPWNLKDEIASSLESMRDGGCRFVTAVPRLRIF